MRPVAFNVTFPQTKLCLMNYFFTCDNITLSLRKCATVLAFGLQLLVLHATLAWTYVCVLSVHVSNCGTNNLDHSISIKGGAGPSPYTVQQTLPNMDLLYIQALRINYVHMFLKLQCALHFIYLNFYNSFLKILNPKKGVAFLLYLFGSLKQLFAGYQGTRLKASQQLQDFLL